LFNIFSIGDRKAIKPHIVFFIPEDFVPELVDEELQCGELANEDSAGRWLFNRDHRDVDGHRQTLVLFLFTALPLVT